MTVPGRDQADWTVTTTGPTAPSPQERRADLRALARHVLVGLVVGALLGVLVGVTRPATGSASAVLSIQPVQPLSAVSIGPTGTQDATTFIQGELIVLNGGDLRSRVQSSLGLAALPRTTASQIGGTYAVTLTAQAKTPRQAVQSVKALADTYTAERQARLQDEVTQALASVSTQLDSLREALALPALQPAVNGTVNLQAQGLQTELGRLLAVNSSLTLSRGQLGRAVAVLQTPEAAGEGQLPPAVRYGLAGSLLGALAGLGVLLLRRRLVAARPDASELTGLGVPVLLPELTAGGREGEPLTRVRAAAAPARLLGARLLGSRDGKRALVLFGATRSIDTTFPAAALALQLADRGPVLLLQAADVVDGDSGDGPGLLDLLDRQLDASALLQLARTTPLPGVEVVRRGTGSGGPEALARLVDAGLLDAAVATGRTVVVDAPALDTSTAVLDLARRAGGVAVVAGRGTTRGELLAVVDVFAADGVQLTGVVVADGVRRGHGQNDEPTAQPGTAGRPGPDQAAARPGLAQAGRTGRDGEA